MLFNPFSRCCPNVVNGNYKDKKKAFFELDPHSGPQEQPDQARVAPRVVRGSTGNGVLVEDAVGDEDDPPAAGIVEHGGLPGWLGCLHYPRPREKLKIHGHDR